MWTDLAQRATNSPEKAREVQTPDRSGAPVHNTDSVTSGLGVPVLLVLFIMVPAVLTIWLFSVFKKRKWKSSFDGLLDEDPPKVE